MKTWLAKEGDVEKKWWIMDANGQTLGRLATQIATVLRGKNKPQFTPSLDTGDFVVLINAEKIKLSGNKMLSKTYFRHSGYFGSLKETSAEEMLQKDPEKMIHLAVKGMLPKGPLGYAMIKKLKVYADATHPHTAQQPQVLDI